MRTKLYLITGFLGSGKTTLMKRLLDSGSGMRTGVIMNEFGRESIDGALLGSDGLLLTEINNGSVFCTCRSDRFIEALVQMSSMKLDSIFIETSGMANPRGMGEILEIAQKKSSHEYDYRGCITMVDATNLLKLVEVSPTVREQLSHADVILINKTDLSDPLKLSEIESKIKTINASAPVFRTGFSELPKEMDLLGIKSSGPPEGRFTNKSESGVRKVSVRFKKSLSHENFKKFLEEFSPITYRFKGFVKLEGIDHVIDCAENSISLKPMEKPAPGYYAEIISDSKKPLLIKFRQAYRSMFNEDPDAD